MDLNKHTIITFIITVTFFAVSGCSTNGIFAAPSPTDGAQATIPPITIIPPSSTPTATPEPTYTPTLTITPSPLPSETPTPADTATASPTDTPASLAAQALPDSNPIISEYETGQQAYTIEVEGGDGDIVSIDYLLYLPGEYGQDPNKEWPLVLYLHSAGERGKDIELLKQQGLPKMLDGQDIFPFIVVSPQQKSEFDSWSDMIDPVDTLLNHVITHYAADTSRIYLTGISMGGFGTWEYALRYPRRFAAIVPIAGGYFYLEKKIPQNICDIMNLPTWVFHGDEDETVPLYQSEILVDALESCGSTVRFTIYEGVGHEGAWERAFVDPELYAWLLNQSTTN